MLWGLFITPWRKISISRSFSFPLSATNSLIGTRVIFLSVRVSSWNRWECCGFGVGIPEGASQKHLPRAHRALGKRIFGQGDGRLENLNQVVVPRDHLILRPRVEQEIHDEVVNDQG